MTDLFKEILPSILQTKDDVISEENEKDYLPFLVNKALSFHLDCIMHSNQMNILPDLDPLLQYHYYINTIRSYKRPFQKWYKRETIENLELLKEYYGYSSDKAKEALKVLSEDQLSEIKSRLDKGGINERPKRINMGKTKKS